MGVVLDWPKVSLVGRKFIEKLEKMAREASGRKEANEGTFGFDFCCVLESNGKGWYL